MNHGFVFNHCEGLALARWYKDAMPSCVVPEDYKVLREAFRDAYGEIEDDLLASSRFWSVFRNNGKKGQSMQWGVETLILEFNGSGWQEFDDLGRSQNLNKAGDRVR
jgi:hypothetical protein